MGNWNISIRGVGPHGNGQPFDAEQLATEVVKKLKAAGHTVVAAEVHTGGVTIVQDGQYGGSQPQAPTVLPIKEQG